MLARRYGSLMRAYATRLLGSSLESDDVVQETFILAWQKLGEVSDGAAVKSWLMRIVSNKSIDRIRARKHYVDITEWDAAAPASQSPSHLAEVSVTFGALSSAVQRLPETQRQCWVMKEVGGSSYAEIADQLGLPQATVRGQLARARATLMKEMEVWR